MKRWPRFLARNISLDPVRKVHLPLGTSLSSLSRAAPNSIHSKGMSVGNIFCSLVSGSELELQVFLITAEADSPKEIRVASKEVLQITAMHRHLPY